MDAGLKGITGDLFAGLTKPPPTPKPQPPPSMPAQPAPSDQRKPAGSPPLRQPKTTLPASSARTARSTSIARKLPAYYYRLPLRAQRCYLASDSIDRFPLTPSPVALTRVANLMTALDGGAPSMVQRASQSLLDEVCRLLLVRPVRLEVRNVRPHNSRGELHGLFYPRAPIRSTATAGTRTVSRPATVPAGEPLIVLWMRTAQRHGVVKARTFLRTLMHELGHYLDYALLKLDDSYHSGGFYQRESFLVRTLCPTDITAPGSRVK